jgi:hypothetical protein
MSSNPLPPLPDRDCALLARLREAGRERDPIPEALLAAMHEALGARMHRDAAPSADGDRYRLPRKAEREHR